MNIYIVMGNKLHVGNIKMNKNLLFSSKNSYPIIEGIAKEGFPLDL